MIRDGIFAILICAALYVALVQLPALAIILEVADTLNQTMEQVK